MGLVTGLLANILGLYLADLWVVGFAVSGGWKGYLIAGIVLGALNLILRPLLKFISFPLIILTLGLFIIVINAIILWLAAQLTGLVFIENIYDLLWATMVVALANLLFKPFK